MVLCGAFLNRSSICMLFASWMRKILAFQRLMSAVHIHGWTLVYTIGGLAIGLIQTWWYV